VLILKEMEIVQVALSWERGEVNGESREAEGEYADEPARGCEWKLTLNRVGADAGRCAATKIEKVATSLREFP
jgi:hypothetical protein